MLGFTSPAYLVFLAVSAVLYRFCPLRFRTAYLLLLSYLFYVSYNLWAAALLVGATLATFMAARLIDYKEQSQGSRRTRVIVAISVIGLTGLLGVYKIAPLMGLTSLVAPLGVSYYTFKLISYVVDVYWRKYRAGSDLIAFSLYVVFFPQIVAGPIQRPGDFLAQLSSASPNISEGVLRIAAGLYKKLLIADNLGISVAYVYSHMTSLTGVPLLLGFCLFPLQLYADFSGLRTSLSGVDCCLAFAAPRISTGRSAPPALADWRRWHMSLTTWLTDYVFTPLRMATRNAGQWGLAFSIAINMIAIGLWHGLTWTYFAFGCTHAIYLIVDALSAGKRRKFFKRRPELNQAGDWFGWALTMFLVAIAAVFFRARSLSDAGWLFAHVANLSNLTATDWTGLLNPAGVRGIGIGLAGYAVLELLGRFDLRAAISRSLTGAPRWVQWFRYAAAAFLSFSVCCFISPLWQQQNRFLV